MTTAAAALAAENGELTTRSSTTGSSSAALSPLTTTRTYNNKNKDCQQQEEEQQANRRTGNVIVALRLSVLLLLIAGAATAATTIFQQARQREVDDFHDSFTDSTQKIVTAFAGSSSNGLSHSLGVLDSLSSQATSHALHNNLTFPLITIPNFAVQGTIARILTGSFNIYYAPIVTDDTREAWETYSLENRGHMDEAFDAETVLRQNQDEQFGLNAAARTRSLEVENLYYNSVEDGTSNRSLQDGARFNFSTLDDGSNFHTKIWSSGAVASTPPGDIALGSGPYAPIWQISPISNTRQRLLNLDIAVTQFGQAGIEKLIESKEAVMGEANGDPSPAFVQHFNETLTRSQYREHVEAYAHDPITFLFYPVFDSFDKENRQLAGAILAGFHWRTLLSNILTSKARGVICVVQNSFNQTFSYRIDASEATYLGMIDFHDPEYNDMTFTVDTNDIVKERLNVENTAYLTVPLNSDIGQYTLRIYPTAEYEAEYITDGPVGLCLGILSVFLFTSIVFIVYSFLLERLQRRTMQKALENAERSAQSERDLNEFLSHEVRNPLSAAICACTLVTSTLTEDDTKGTLTCKRDELLNDMSVINCSLSFINDFLRSMLDLRRAQDDMLKFKLAPTDLLTDVIEPVAAMMNMRNAPFDLQVDCPSSLMVTTDSLRLKQVILNLVRNASKFMEKGFIRIRADIKTSGDKNVVISIEDSGPGIPVENQATIFKRYQASLDLLTQGTGIGLCLSKTLMTSMGGDLIFDASYSSGLGASHPGARFVVDLNRAPLAEGGVIPSHCETTKQLEAPEATANCNGSCTRTIEVGEHPQRNDPQREEPSASHLPATFSVLFVDDNTMQRKLYSRALQRLAPSWSIKQAACGEQSIELCKEETFDLIFMDQYMSSAEKQLLGTETCHALRSQGVKSIICGLSANNVEEDFLRNGANMFTLKPFPCKEDELDLLLQRILA